MASLTKITGFLDKYLENDKMKDYSWNGIQIRGKPEVKKIMTAVDSGTETFEKAVEMGADLVIVHHGLFWKEGNPSIDGVMKKRIDLLYKNNISLYVSHLPLDRHKVIGNNAILLKMLGAEPKDKFSKFDDTNIGWIGKSRKPLDIKEIEKILNKELSTRCTVLNHGKKNIISIATCSGGGDRKDFEEAVSKGVDLYITGEQTEIYHDAKDNDINVIFCGHHASEIVGVRALAKLLNKKFDVEAEFIDIKTGL